MSTCFAYKYYCLDSNELILKFTKLIGAPTMVGVRKRKPNLRTVSTTKSLDCINVLSKADIYISYAKIRLRLHAYRHVLGVDTNNNVSLLTNLPPLEPNAVITNQPISTLKVNSKFDYDGNVCKVVSVSPDQTVLALSLWGPRKGEDIVFNTVEEVVNFVNAKRG
jgi:hypothetical protein